MMQDLIFERDSSSSSSVFAHNSPGVSQSCGEEHFLGAPPEVRRRRRDARATCRRSHTAAISIGGVDCEGGAPDTPRIPAEHIDDNSDDGATTTNALGKDSATAARRGSTKDDVGL